jgi:uncharacterized protein YbjT (DUF2867 family)
VIIVSGASGQLGRLVVEELLARGVSPSPTDGHEFRAYDITGPAVVLPQDIARAVSDITGRPIEVLAAETCAAPARGPMSSPSFSVVSTAVEDLTGRITVRDLLEAHRDDLSRAGR